MIKKWLIQKLFKVVIGITVLGIGIWYLSSAIGGVSLSYTSVDTFFQQIGAGSTDSSGVPGCFLCGYIAEMFAVLNKVTEMFWTGIIHNLWVLMAVGFGIFLIFHTIKFFQEQATSKDTQNLTKNIPSLDFKKWFEKVWKTGLRVLIAGVLIGALNWAGTTGSNGLRTITNVIVTPVMYIGSELSAAATGVISNSACETKIAKENDNDVLTPVLKPFMCIIGNLNTVMLAGAGGGFALMNYAWLGFGGGLFTWLAGLALVIAFLVIGFNLFFEVLSVIFKLIFVIIFMPLLLAAAAFEQVWSLAKGLLNASIDMLINSTVSVIRISLKICIIYAIVYFSAAQNGFTTILPPLLGDLQIENPTDESTAVLKAFRDCEKISLVDGQMDKDKFKPCFIEQQHIVEAQYPHAFDFMSNGFSFFIFMIGIVILYFWVVSPEIDKMLPNNKEDSFDYGKWIKDFGRMTYNAPGKTYESIKKLIDKGK